MAERDVDFAIAGAGPAGAACALFLRERGIAASRIALIDARMAEAAAADDRMIAISQGSATLLTRLGAWRDGIDPRATAIHTIHVSHRGHFGRTIIDRDDYGVAALGHVIRHGDLTRALDRALARQGIVVRRPLRVATIAIDDNDLRVAMADGSSLTTRHVIHAEGGLFDTQQRRAIHRDYGQSAVTSFVTTTETQSDALAATAFERFTTDGPIALLPAIDAQPDGRERRGYSLVWCGKPDDSAARIALSDDQFRDALHAAFGDRLGGFASVGARRTFPLGLNAVDKPARARTAHGAEFAIGNAAQTLHPVAGQGLNLGLRDAHELADLLVDDQRDPARDATALTARYIAARRADRATTVNLTDFMPRVFANPRAAVAVGRGLTLALLDVARPLRGLFARQMMNGRR
jgi:2-octaprenyl-6-methoxyphenol hydroxylase